MRHYALFHVMAHGPSRNRLERYQALLRSYDELAPQLQLNNDKVSAGVRDKEEEDMDEMGDELASSADVSRGVLPVEQQCRKGQPSWWQEEDWMEDIDWNAVPNAALWTLVQI